METSWEIFSRTENAWEAMYSDCEKAKRSIDLEQYIFLRDEVGNRFLDLFLLKAKEGVRVRLLLDAIGSFSFFISGTAESLREQGVEIIFFNAPGFWKQIFKYYFRDHRKILIVDGEIAHTGGVCVQADMSEWRDTHIRLSGPILSDMTQIFEKMWQRSLKKKFIPSGKPSDTKDDFRAITNAPLTRERRIYYELLDKIRSAKRYIYITSPYFIPTHRLRQTIRAAIGRGVDVRILLPGKSDHSFVDRASNYYITKILRLGGRVFRYHEAILHAKSLVMDDTWVTVGSANIDNWSLLFNYEFNIATTRTDFIGSMRELFLEDIKNSRELLPAEWFKRSWKERFLDYATLPFHRFL